MASFLHFFYEECIEVVTLDLCHTHNKNVFHSCYLISGGAFETSASGCPSGSLFEGLGAFLGLIRAL